MSYHLKPHDLCRKPLISPYASNTAADQQPRPRAKQNLNDEGIYSSPVVDPVTIDPKAVAAAKLIEKQLQDDSLPLVELRNICKSRKVSHRNFKTLLRAELMRSVRRELGKPVMDITSYETQEGQQQQPLQDPRELDDPALTKLLLERGFSPPCTDDSRYDRAAAEDLALACLEVEDLIPPDPSEKSYSWYEKKSVHELRQMCKDNGIILKNMVKAEMIDALWSVEREKKLGRRRAEVANQECFAPLAPLYYIWLKDPKTEDRLEGLRATADTVDSMSLQNLRAELYERRLPIYGTLEVLRERLIEALRSDVRRAVGGGNSLHKQAYQHISRIQLGKLVEELKYRALQIPTLALQLRSDVLIQDLNYLISQRESAEGYKSALLNLPDDEQVRMRNFQDEFLKNENVLARNEDELKRLGVSLADLRGPLKDSFNESQAQLVEALIDEAVNGVFDALRRKSPILESIRIAAAGGIIRDEEEESSEEDSVEEEEERGSQEEAIAEHILEQYPFLSDPTLTVAALCGGVTVSDKEASLAAARACIEALQSDLYHGTVGNPDSTAGRQGIAVNVYYYCESQDLWHRLNWNHINALSVQELEIALLVDSHQGNTGTSLDRINEEVDVAIPLGSSLPGLPGSPLGMKMAGGSAAIIGDRVHFKKQLEDLGYPSVPLLRVSLEELHAMAYSKGEPTASETHRRVVDWLTSQGFDPESARVAVRAEAQDGGGLVGAAAVKGSLGALRVALQVMDKTSTEAVTLQAIHPDAKRISVSVVSAPDGTSGQSGFPVALVPVEMSYYDIEEVIEDYEYSYERFDAIRRGLEETGVEAVLAATKAGNRVHPEYIGGPARPSQRLRHTVPADIPPRTLAALRAAAVDLFVEFGFQDFAEFSCWILPAKPAQTNPLLAAKEAAAVRIARGDGPEQGVGTVPSRRFSDLVALDQQELDDLPAPPLIQIKEGEGNFGALILDSERLFSDNPFQPNPKVPINPYRENGKDYGVFKGIKIDDRVRSETIEELVPKATGPPVPGLAPPLPEYQDPLHGVQPPLSSAVRQGICVQPDGTVIAFDKVSCTPAIGGVSSPLRQAAAAVGIALEDLIRIMVSGVALRNNGVEVPLRPSPPSVNADLTSEVDSVMRPTTWRGDEVDLEDLKVIGETMPFLPRMAVPAESRSSTMPDLDVDDSEREGAWLQEDEGRSNASVGGDEEVSWSGNLMKSLDEAEEEPFDFYDPLTVEDITLGGDMEEGGAESVAHGDLQDEEEEEFTKLEALQEDHPNLHPQKQKVWVLCGGDGPQKDVSLHSALHALRSLEQDQELLVEAFLLEPSDCGLASEESARGHLERRLYYQKLGIGDDQMAQDFPSLHPARIRVPEPSRIELHWRGVWKLASGCIVRPTVDDLQVACESLQSVSNIPQWRLPEETGIHAFPQAVLQRIGEEARMNGMPSGGKGEWGEVASAGTVPQYCLLREWLLEAKKSAAVVVPCLGSGAVATQGPLQMMFEELGIPFTGPTSVSAEQAADRTMVANTLNDLIPDTIRSPPSYTFSTPELVSKAERDIHELMLEIQQTIPDQPGYQIRPAHDVGSDAGLVRIGRAEDLAVYAKAVREWWNVIPAGALDYEEQDIPMPIPPPNAFNVEPYAPLEEPMMIQELDKKTLRMVVQPSKKKKKLPSSSFDIADAIIWNGKDNPWVEVSACVLGSLGDMRCLGLTATVLHCQVVEETAAGKVAAELERKVMAESNGGLDGKDGGEEQLSFNGMLHITPPPPSIISPAHHDKAKEAFVLAATTLALSGAAQIDALMNAFTGQVCVLNVDTSPDMSPDSLLMKQAAASGLSSYDVFKELLTFAMKGADIDDASEQFEDAYDDGVLQYEDTRMSSPSGRQIYGFESAGAFYPDAYGPGDEEMEQPGPPIDSVAE